MSLEQALNTAEAKAAVFGEKGVAFLQENKYFDEKGVFVKYKETIVSTENTIRQNWLQRKDLEVRQLEAALRNAANSVVAETIVELEKPQSWFARFKLWLAAHPFRRHE